MSTLKADTIVAADGTSPVTLTKQSAAKTWVNFKGTSTVTINDSFAVSSITDDSTGNYFVNNANAMSDGNYNVAVTSNSKSTGTSSGNTASLYKIFTFDPNSSVDAGGVFGNSHGDLA